MIPADPKRLSLIQAEGLEIDRTELVSDFYALLLSDAALERKITQLCANWGQLCKSPTDIEVVFYAVDVLDSLVLCGEDYRKDLLAFLCFSVLKSERVRSYVLHQLFYEDVLYTHMADLPVSDLVTIVASCSLDLVTDSDMRRVLDFLLTLPHRYVLEQLLIIKKLSRSLDFIKRDHAVRLSHFVGTVVHEFLGGHIRLPEHQERKFATTLVAIAKKINRAVGHSRCFNPEHWRKFLRFFKLEHEISDVCHEIYVIQDADDLPFKKKKQRVSKY